MIFSVAPLMAQQTAYAAIKAVQQAKPSELTSKILEIRGVQGATQPLVWVVAAADASARGGFREFEIADSRILSERTPVRPGEQRPPEVPINMNLLNMDSDGAFIAANNTAKKMQIGFDSVNYRLYARDQLGLPAWVVQLVNWDGTIAATIEIAANDGAIIRTSRESDNGSTIESGSNTDDGIMSSTGRTLDKAGRATKRTIWKGAATVEEWFTGQRTLDQDLE